jgi:hypothetical protein
MLSRRPTTGITKQQEQDNCKSTQFVHNIDALSNISYGMLSRRIVIKQEPQHITAQRSAAPRITWWYW